MIRRLGKVKYDVYAFDVESHNDDESIAKKETSIWLYSFINEESKMEDESSYGYSIEDFLSRLETMTSKRRKHGQKRPCNNIAIYIFNLAFEWSFIFPVLMAQGFHWEEQLDEKSEKAFSLTATKTASSVWEASIKFSKDGGIVKLRDLCKIFQGSLANVAKSFGLETQKDVLEGGYTLNRLHGHVVTQREKEYCFKDTKIIMDILVKMDELNDSDFWTSISASTYAMKKMLARGYPKTHKPYMAFRRMYPPEIGEEAEFLRKTVAGGITYALESWQFVDIKSTIRHWDMHQAHPSSAYSNYFPIGEGKYFEGIPPESMGVRINAVHVRVSYVYAKVHSVIKLIGMPIAQNVELWLWDFEIPLMYRCYEGLNVEFIDGYQYHVRYLPWKDFYNDNYQARKKAKAEHDLFQISQRKLLNNSSYGKLIEKAHKTVFQPFLDKNHLIDSNEIPAKKPQEFAKYACIKIGSCIPAYTRVRLVSTALMISNGGCKSAAEFKRKYPNADREYDSAKDIIYFDTDSIFFLESEYTLEGAKHLNAKDELLGWGEEPVIHGGQFLAPKRYKIMEEVGQGDGFVMLEPTIHAAGVNFTNSPDYDVDLIKGHFDIRGRMRVKGGTIIVMKPKQMQVQDKYKTIYAKNKGKVV